MKNRLPVYIENLKLPDEDDKVVINNENKSLGFVNFLYLLIIIISSVSLGVILLLLKK